MHLQVENQRAVPNAMVHSLLQNLLKERDQLAKHSHQKVELLRLLFCQMKT